MNAVIVYNLPTVLLYDINSFTFQMESNAKMSEETQGKLNNCLISLFFDVVLSAVFQKFCSQYQLPLYFTIKLKFLLKETSLSKRLKIWIQNNQLTNPKLIHTKIEKFQIYCTKTFGSSRTLQVFLTMFFPNELSQIVFKNVFSMLPLKLAIERKTLHMHMFALQVYHHELWYTLVIGHKLLA